MQIELATALLALASALIGGLLSGWFSVRAKNTEYENEYYKTVLKKRINAYEHAERLVATLKTAVMDDDHQPYHFLFSREESEIHAQFAPVMAAGIWISDELFALTRNLNVLFFEHGSGKDLVGFGKVNYQKIATIREKMEHLIARDMADLHKVPAFLRRKKKALGFSSVGRRGGKGSSSD